MTLSGFCRALIIAGLGFGTASATTINFTYSGTGDPYGDPVTASGSGSFTTIHPISNGVIGESDLSAFSFSLTVISGLSDNFTYTGLLPAGDLTSFQASFSGGLLTDLQLTTDHQSATNNWNEAFTILSGGLAYTDNGDMGSTSAGTITVADASTPEPATLSLMGAALLLGLAPLVRRFRTTAYNR